MLRFNLQLFDATWDNAKKDLDRAIASGDKSGAEAALNTMKNADKSKNGGLTATNAYSNYESQIGGMKSSTSSGSSGGSSGGSRKSSTTDDYGNIDYSALLNSGLGKSIDSYSDEDYQSLVNALNQRAEKLAGMKDDPNYQTYLDAQANYQQQINDIGAYRNQQKQIDEMNKNYQEMLDDFYDRYDNLSTRMNDYDFQQTEEYKTLLPIYQEMYRQLGEDARKNTLADASGLTGGLTNSYALAASQQANNQYNTKFTQDVIPTLMDMAYNRFANGANFELENLNSAQGLLSQIANADQNYLNNVMNLYGNQRNNYVNDRNFNEGVREYNQNFDYQKERDAIADEQWLKSFEEGVREYEKSYGLSLAKASKSSSSSSASADEKNNAKQIALQAFNEALKSGGDPTDWLNKEYVQNLPISTASILGTNKQSSGLTNGEIIAESENGSLVMSELLNLIKTYQSARQKDNDNISLIYS